MLTKNVVQTFAATAGLVVICLTMSSAIATDYANNPNPACRLMRNSDTGAPVPVEPNGVDTRVAVVLGGNVRSPKDRLPVVRRMYAEALPLLLKIDSQDIAVLSELPPSTPRIDLVIDRHLANLTWARATLGVFYEEGRATPVDYAQAARFYQKSIDTRFVDDRACVHSFPPAFATSTHLAGLYAYGLGVAQDRVKARRLLQEAGSDAASAVLLLDGDALPRTYGGYLNTDWDALADDLKAPRPLAGGANTLYGPGATFDAPLEAAPRLALWAIAAAVLLFIGLVLVRLRSVEQDGSAPQSIYATGFAVYKTIAGLVVRIGLVLGGVIGCVTGVWMMSLAYSFGISLWQVNSLSDFLGIALGVTGLGAFFGGLAKLAESLRVRSEPPNAQVHGDARAAAQDEAKKAARGIAVGPNLSAREFRD